MQLKQPIELCRARCTKQRAALGLTSVPNTTQVTWLLRLRNRRRTAPCARKVLPGTLYLAMAAACARALSSPPPVLLTGRGALMGASPSAPRTCKGDSHGFYIATTHQQMHAVPVQQR